MEGGLLYDPLEDSELKTMLKVTRNLAKKNELSKSVAMDLDYYFESYDTMKEKIQIMISSYLDSPEILSQLLEINDNMEIIAQKYRDKIEGGKGSTGSSSDDDIVIPPEFLVDTKESMNQKSESPEKSSKDPKSDLEDPSKTPDNKSEKDEKKEKSPEPSFIYDPTNTSEFECPICMDPVPIGKGFVVSECNHSYCLGCMKEFLNTLIKEGRVLEVACCTPKCPSRLTYYDIKYCTDSENFQKYEEFTLLMTLKADPTVKWCPNPKGCGNAIYTDQMIPGNNRVDCGACRYEFCKECMEPWHTGTCEQYQQWKVENGKVDDSISKYLKDHSIEVKKCPRCKMRIEKNEGCNHMTCGSCQFQFCWLCGGKYSDNHYSAFNPLGCPGMQFKNDKKVNKGKLIAKKVGIGAGIVLSLPLVIPAVIIGGPVYGGYRLHRWRKHGY